MEASLPEPVKFFIAILLGKEALIEEVEAGIQRAVGETDYRSPEFPFEHTDYYEEEMGAGLRRVFLSLHGLRSPADLVDMKWKCSELENEWRQEGNRLINLDPGFLDATKVVLASFKPGGWKIFLDRGVYADMTLYYAKGSFIRFGWTFPDFRTGTYDRVLLHIRRSFKEQRKNR